MNLIFLTISICFILIIFYFFSRFLFLSSLKKEKIKNTYFTSWNQKNHFKLRDGYIINYKSVINNQSEFIFICIHGMISQKEDYDHFLNFVKKTKLISAVAYDRRGSGSNKKWIHYSLSEAVNDLKEITFFIKKKFPDKKIILLGESLGSALIANLIKNNSSNKIISGIILINFVTKYIPFNLFNLNFKFIYSTLTALAFNGYKQIDLTSCLDPLKFCLNKDHILNFVNRKGNIDFLTARFLLQSRKMSFSVPKILSKIKNNIFVISSSDDVFRSKIFYKRRLKKNYWKKKEIYYKQFNGSHALLNESNNQQVFNEIKLWLNKIK